MVKNKVIKLLIHSGNFAHNLFQANIPFVVGVTGLEPATSRPPAVRASQLRHTPILIILSYMFFYI